MRNYEEEFESSGQESVRLSIALKRFTEIQDPVRKKNYEKYLALRFRPAVTELIRQGDIFRIKALFTFAPVTEPALATFVDDAATLHQEEILSFLLEFKREHFGFHDRDFTL